ncbi:hypothetical protein O3G_MSEX013322, partial [Manduca sexta]
HNVPHLPDVERVHSERSEETYRTHVEEAIVRQVLDEGPRRDGLRMTQVRGESAVSTHHADCGRGRDRCRPDSACHADSDCHADSACHTDSDCRDGTDAASRQDG